MLTRGRGVRWHLPFRPVGLSPVFNHFSRDGGRLPRHAFPPIIPTPVSCNRGAAYTRCCPGILWVCSGCPLACLTVTVPTEPFWATLPESNRRRFNHPYSWAALPTELQGHRRPGGGGEPPGRGEKEWECRDTPPHSHFRISWFSYAQSCATIKILSETIIYLAYLPLYSLGTNTHL